jgi:hypothetical protein
MTSRAIKGNGLDALDRASGIAGFDADSAKALAQRLEAYRAAGQAWAGMWAVEYEWVSSLTTGQVPEIASHLPDWMVRDYAYHPHRTTQLLADFYRAFRRTAWASTCGAMDFPVGWDPTDPWQKLRVLVGPNSVGRRLVNPAGFPNLVRFALRRCQLDAEVSATQARLALRAWREEHGGLPKTLHDLVPGYLDAVPTDPFDGLELRYDAAAERVWSVGSDLRDRHGQVSDDDDPMREIAFAL